MCGIAGVIDFRKAPLAETVKTMTDALVHRGPDGEGYFARDKVILGHRRLKILDLSEHARQPLADPEMRAVVTFNGEIYNYLDLKELLVAKGHRFSSSGDTEVIPHAYLEWGLSFLRRLRGMFAFGLYDTTARTL